MSNISLNCVKVPIELTSSRWPLRFWLIAAALALVALCLSGLPPIGQLLSGVVLSGIGLLEWRQRRQLRRLQFSAEAICCTLHGGETLEATWPLSGMVNRYWVSFALPAGFRRRVWLIVYHDQLSADDFRRLSIMMGR